MANRYDTSTTVFNPKGSIRQVEYAMESVSGSGTCIGILAKDGILLAAERRKVDKLLDETMFLEKIYKINDDVVCGIAGIISDANVLLQEIRLIAQRHYKRYGEPIPCEQLVALLCDLKQAYTQFGGKRPFGVSILYMGWDKHYGFQLYKSDPSGSYFGWKAICVGRHCDAVMSLLKKEYKEGEMSLKSAQMLALKCLRKSFNVKRLRPEKVEMALLTRNFMKTNVHILKQTEIAQVIKEFENPELGRSRH